MEIDDVASRSWDLFTDDGESTVLTAPLTAKKPVRLCEDRELDWESLREIGEVVWRNERLEDFVDGDEEEEEEEDGNGEVKMGLVEVEAIGALVFFFFCSLFLCFGLL